MKKLINVRSAIILLVLCFTTVSYVNAATQSNFQISPPPMAYPEFEADKKDQRVEATYISMTGSGLDLKGLGGNYIGRRAFNDKFALDGLAGLFYMTGTMKIPNFNLDMNYMNIPLGANVEFQPYKSKGTNVILFAGPTFSLGMGSLKGSSSTATTNTDMTIYTYTYMYGLEGGGQFTADAGDFKISPFLMLQSMAGSSSSDTTTKSTYTYYIGSTKYTSPSSSSSSSSTSIPAFTTLTYGLDILYVPWNMALSTILQEATKSGDNDGFKTTIIQLGFKF